MGRFHGFFTQHGGFLTDHNRKLAFDKGYFPALYAAAMTHPALCMSVVAMATSYIAVHNLNRATPDADTLVVYSQTFDTIRFQIQKEEKEKVSEFTVLAVLQTLMCSGIGFADIYVSLAHWRGVTVLLNEYPYLRLSGRVMFFVTQIEYWMSISFGIAPKGDEWPKLLPNSRALPEKYGGGFSEIFDLPGLQSEVSTKLLSVAVTICRATEVLETTAVNNPSTNTSPPYFIHPFDVLLRQQARLHATLMHRNDPVECVCITLNIYFMLVIKSTPWRAPIEGACLRLQHCLTVCDLYLELDAITPGSEHSVSTMNDEENEMIRDLYLWMLMICACALQLCRDQNCSSWTINRLRAVCRDDLDLTNENGKVEALDRIRRFCWSDIFLGPRVNELCALLSYRVEEVL